MLWFTVLVSSVPEHRELPHRLMLLIRAEQHILGSDHVHPQFRAAAPPGRVRPQSRLCAVLPETEADYLRGEASQPQVCRRSPVVQNQRWQHLETRLPATQVPEPVKV